MMETELDRLHDLEKKNNILRHSLESDLASVRMQMNAFLSAGNGNQIEELRASFQQLDDMRRAKDAEIARLKQAQNKVHAELVRS